MVTTVQNIAQLHHHRIATNPDRPLRCVLRKHTRNAKRCDSFANIAVHVANCASRAQGVSGQCE